MQRRLIAGNWKMNGLKADLAQLDGIASAALLVPGIDVALCLPHTLIGAAASRQSAIRIGAQDCHAASAGAYTGCVAAEMLADAGAEYVIVGHSERRIGHRETNKQVMAKALAAQSAGLISIICVGEPESEMEAGNSLAYVRRQLLESLAPDLHGDIVIAYEPIWAIGTGRTSDIAGMVVMHQAIRTTLTAIYGDACGSACRIIYGGSVSPTNAQEILLADDVNGVLVGGASLKVESFQRIIDIASDVLDTVGLKIPARR